MFLHTNNEIPKGEIKKTITSKITLEKYLRRNQMKVGALYAEDYKTLIQEIKIIQ